MAVREHRDPLRAAAVSELAEHAADVGLRTPDAAWKQGQQAERDVHAALASAGGQRRALAAEALDRPAEPILEWGLRLEADQRAGARDVEVAGRLPVGVRAVPDD